MIDEIINDLQRIADRKCYPEDILDGSIAQEWIDYITNLQQQNKQLKEKLENDIDRYEDTISYQLGFDKGKEYMQQRIDKANELLSKIVVCEREDGNWGAVKNTRKQDVYETIWKLYKILDTSSYRRNEMLKILGDKKR